MRRISKTRPLLQLSRLTAALTVWALVLLGGCDAEAPVAVQTDLPLAASADGLGGNNHLRVMSRNLYLGGDVGPVLQVDFSDIVAVTEAAATVWASVLANDFPSRAEALADEIARTEPHVIGLQEVVRFITLDAQFQPTAVLDYLDILQSELAERGLHYQAIVQDNTDVVLPIGLDLQVGAVTEYLKFTDRIATLVRSDVGVTDVAQGNYQAQLTLTPGVTLKRGWIRVSSEHGSMPYTLVNTHLETQGLAPVQAGQTAELLGVVTSGLDEVTFVLGDLNSDAAGGPGVPSWTPTYNDMLEAGFVDVWRNELLDAAPDFTCCNDPDLLNGPGSLDQRIDFILVRGAPTTPTGAFSGSILPMLVGTHPWERTSSGLWPSDHAGLVAAVRLAPGLLADGS